MKLAKRTLVVAALALCTAVEADDAEQARMEVIELNRQIMEANQSGDPSALIEHSADQFRVIAPGGRVEDKAMAVAGVGSVKSRGYELSEEEVTLFGDTAILIGKIVIDGEMQPVGKLPPMKFMSVFKRSNGSWQMIGRSLTPCLKVAMERGVC